MRLHSLVDCHLTWLQSMQYAASTLENRRTSLRQLVEWASDQGLEKPNELDLTLVEAYRTHLSCRCKADGQPLTVGTQVQRLLAVKMFLCWLHQRGHIEGDLATSLRFPRRPQSLPQGVLNQMEVERVLRVPDLNTATGYRDRVMLEVLYATGVRRSELANLQRDDVDRGRRVLFILKGKGGKDRVVPISERALWWIAGYLADARPKLVRGDDSEHLFLTAWGRAMSAKRLSVLVAAHIAASGVRKRGSCHLFRHTTATLMLEGGADIRYIQELLV